MNNLKHGEGKIIELDGTVQEGKFEKGKLVRGKVTAKDGKLIKVVHKDLSMDLRTSRNFGERKTEDSARIQNSLLLTGLTGATTD